MKCIAIDDQQPELDLISEFCKRIKSVDLKGTFTDPLDAIKLLNSEEIDLIILDIHMPRIDGFEFLKLLYNPPLVIFATAYREYALQGFDNDAVDYLIKPYPFDRFSKAINKASKLLKLKQRTDAINEDNLRISCGFMMVKVEYSTILVNLNDILYIEGMKDYVKIYSGGKPILTKTTMKNIIDKLPPDRFFRVHKSFIVSVDKINMIENSRIIINNQRIPIGESFRTPFFEMVSRNSI
jgi:DNA-binding LytR/AlgR family response regulator